MSKQPLRQLLSPLALISALVLVSACSSEQPEPLLYQVVAQDLVVTVPAKGELFSAKATIINAPMTRRGMQNIAWLAPEFSLVKEGDVIARFDGEAMNKESNEKQLDLDINLQEIIEKGSILNLQLEDINKDIGLISQETLFAKNFTIEDERIRAKIDILDELQNTEFLLAKEEYLHWKSDSFSASSEGEMGLLTMKKQQNENKIKILQESLSQLEVKAPHDGLLTYQADWRGEKPLVGKGIWPGRKFAELPDITEMKVKLFVLENEAINLAVDKKVSFYLNAHSSLTFNGNVESVAQFPQSIKRGDPQKYFEVIVNLEKQQKKLFVPGRKLEAKIYIAKKKQQILIPLQSVFTNENQSFVYLYQNGAYVQSKVTLGQVSLSHVEITSGLQAGQKIALTDMGNS
ncbi:MAG: efflux RND transporter periplasmic adaptor subunit [Thalassotalea sp.]